MSATERVGRVGEWFQGQRKKNEICQVNTIVHASVDLNINIIKEEYLYVVGRVISGILENFSTKHQQQNF